MGSFHTGRSIRPKVNWRETERSQNIWTDLCKPARELEVNVAKLGVMVSKFIIDVYGAKEEVNFGTYGKYLHTLEEWSASLPQSLRYFPDHSRGAIHPSLSTEDEVASVSLSPQPGRRQSDFIDLSCLALPRGLLPRNCTSHDETVAAPCHYGEGRSGHFDHSPEPSILCSDLVRISSVRLISAFGHPHAFGPFSLIMSLPICSLDSAIQIGHVSSKMVKREFICKRWWLIT